jgi:CheY-like chemotaxis protein
MAAPRLGDILVESRVVSREDIDRALAASRGRRLASTILEMGLASERAVCRGLARVHGHPAISLEESRLSLEAARVVPRDVARIHNVLPLALDDVAVTVACADVDTRPVFAELALVFARRVETVLVVDSVLEKWIARVYDEIEGGGDTLLGERAAPDAGLAIVRPTVEGAEARVADVLAGASGALSRLRRAARADGARRPVATPDSPAPTDEPVVVVVEDDDAIRKLIVRSLEADGLRVVGIERGDAAARRLRDLVPSLLVLDAMLPGMHGFELCRLVKASERFADVPVLMVSAVYRGYEHAREILEVMRADAFLEKPFPMAQLRKLAGELLARDVDLPKPPSAVIDQLLDAQGRVADLNEAGEHDGALAAVDQWLRLDPFDAFAHLERGLLLLRMRDHQGALRAFEAAALYDRANFNAQANLATTYELLGFVRKAREAWGHAVRCAPDDDARGESERRLEALAEVGA